MRRHAAALGLTLAGLIAAAPTATGWWSSPSAAGGSGSSSAATLPRANAPTATATGPVVTVSWTPSTFSAAPLGYEVLRYASSAGAPSGAGSPVPCTPTAGPGGTLECTEASAPAGTWHYTVRTTLNNWRGPESTPTPALDVYNDTVAPTSTATLSPSAPASGWYASTPVSVSLSATDDMGGAGVARIQYTLDDTDPRSSPSAIVYTAPVSVATTTTVRFAARDRANNWETPNSRTVQIDTQTPAHSLALSGVTGGAHLNGTTVWYRGAAAGSFAVVAAVTDSGGSAPASSSTSALGGPTAGWTHTAGATTTPTGGPYVSNPFSWAAGTTSTPNDTVTSADGAGNTVATTLTFQPDNTAPTTTAVAAPAPNAAGWNTTPVTVTLSAADGGAGVGAIRYTTDGSPPSTSPTSQTYSGPFSVASSATVRYAAVDNVGNTEAAQSLTLQIDTSGPVNALSLSNVTGGAFLAGDTVFYRGVAAGSFELDNALADTGSGRASSTTAALAGATTGWSHTPSTDTTFQAGAYTSNPFAWVAGTSSSPTETVTGADVAGNTTATTLTFVDDSTPPSGSVTFPVLATYSTGSGWAAGCGTGTADICGDATDTGSGLAAVTIALARLSDGKCWTPASGQWKPASCSGVAPSAFTPGATPAWSVSLPCAAGSYTLDVTVRDNVGNATTLPRRAWTQTSCAG